MVIETTTATTITTTTTKTCRSYRRSIDHTRPRSMHIQYHGSSWYGLHIGEHELHYILCCQDNNNKKPHATIISTTSAYKTMSDLFSYFDNSTWISIKYRSVEFYGYFVWTKIHSESRNREFRVFHMIIRIARMWTTYRYICEQELLKCLEYYLLS